jgi:hypothetical protein
VRANGFHERFGDGEPDARARSGYNGGLAHRM